MKTRYKYIHFEHVVDNDYDVVNNRSNETLGFVLWYRDWSCYTFESKGIGYVFNATCLDDISHFLKQLGKPEKIIT